MIFGILSIDSSIGWGERFVLDQRGYDLVTRHLASKYLLPRDKRLILSSPVSKVVHSDNGVTVRTGNGTCYSADYAICTFSLGVLQQAMNGKAPVVFEPDFPTWKKESIVANVMGTYTKIFYQFDHVFWPHDVQYFYYVSRLTNAGILRIPLASMSSSDAYLYHLIGFTNDSWLLESLGVTGLSRQPFRGFGCVVIDMCHLLQTNTAILGIFFATMVYEQSMRIEQQPDDKTMREGKTVLDHKRTDTISHVSQASKYFAKCSQTPQFRSRRPSYTHAGA